MDPVILVSMVFVLVLVTLVGGFIALFPITRRLGLLIEARMQRDRTPGVDPAEFKQLRDVVVALESQVERMLERVEFTEELLAGRDRYMLPPARTDDPSDKA
jgi:hypothetical protein